MQKKIKLLKKISLVVILIITILISTMPYKPKISDTLYSANPMSFDILQQSTPKSQITINKLDSKTKESLDGAKFELTPIKEDIIDNMKDLRKYSISYWESGQIVMKTTHYEDSCVDVEDASISNLKGWALEKDSKEIEYLPGDVIVVNQDINLYAVKYELQYFKKELVQFESEIPQNIVQQLPKITYIENSRKIEFTEDNSQITLLYKLIARGDPGLQYNIIDKESRFAFGDLLEGTIPENGEINCYVTRTFSASDINSQGNIENVATITPGINNNISSSSSKITPAEDNTPSYTVTYLDGTPDGSVFGEQVFTGLKFGEKTPEFTGNLKREGYDFQGWAPAICETVEYDDVYMATWLKRAKLTVIVAPEENRVYVGDTARWRVEIRNSNWADAYNLKLESSLDDGTVLYTKENISIKAGETFKTTVEYVTTEDDIGLTIKNTARVTDFGDNTGSARPIRVSGSHGSGVDVYIDNASTEMISKTQIPVLSKSFSNEQRIIDRDVDYYTFIKDENGAYKSNNKGIGNTDASSYIPIDLSNYEGKYALEVNASISSEEGFDYGYARIIKQSSDKIDFYGSSKEFINISGTVENESYKTILEGGKKYIILFGYIKDGSIDVGEDTFSINSVNLILNSDGLTEKINLQTDSSGKITTEIPDGRYILTETVSPENYKILEYPIIIDVHNNQIKILENKNLDSIIVSNNNELNIENTTSRVIVHYYLKNSEGGYTETKLKEDKILKGIEGTEYKTEPLLFIEKEGINYELEYEMIDRTKKYVIPENDSGTFGKEDINVNYYYQAKKQIIINKQWVDNGNSLGIRPDTINVKLTATIENENGEIIEYRIPNVDSIVELRSKNGTENGDNWTYSWLNLESYDEYGNEIMYCVEEIEVPEEYYSVVEFVDFQHFNIINYKIGSIKITKVDSKDNNIKLGGAEFKLEKIIENNGEINIDENFEPLFLITSTEEETLGEADFEDLEYGKYRLTEIKAPAGYSLLNKPIDIEITESNPDYIGEIANKEKTILPNTGGNGSIVLTMLGVFCIAIAIKIKE